MFKKINKEINQLLHRYGMCFVFTVPDMGNTRRRKDQQPTRSLIYNVQDYTGILVE